MLGLRRPRCRGTPMHCHALRGLTNRMTDLHTYMLISVQSLLWLRPLPPCLRTLRIRQVSSQPRNTQKLGKVFSDLLSLSCGLPGSGTDLAADSAAALDSPLAGRQPFGVVVVALFITDSRMLEHKGGQVTLNIGRRARWRTRCFSKII